MRITNDAIRACRTAFDLKFADAMNAAAAENVYQEFCTEVGDAGFQMVEIPFLEQFGSMREWLDDRVIKNLEEKVITLKERSFEETIGIKARDLETGAWRQKGSIIAAMGQGGERLWDELFFEALTGTKKWIDGKAFFASDRKYGKNSLINNVTTNDLTNANFAAAYKAMCSYVGGAGKPLKVKPTHLLVGPALEDTAREILESEKIKDAQGNEVNNVQRGKVKLVVSSELVGANANFWFMAACGGVIKPVLMQKSVPATLTVCDNLADEGRFMRGEVLFGTEAYGSAAAGFPHLIYRGGNVVA